MIKTGEENPVESVKDAVIIKAFHSLKIKTGPGGFDPMNVKRAERQLENSAHLFPQVASDDIVLIESMLAMVQDNAVITDANETTRMLNNVLSSVVELKAHSTMFRYPLVTEVLENLLPFCMSLTGVTPLARDVITEHLRVLKVAIAQGPRAITAEDHDHLLSGLKKAVAKVLRHQE